MIEKNRNRIFFSTHTKKIGLRALDLDNSQLVEEKEVHSPQGRELILDSEHKLAAQQCKDKELSLWSQLGANATTKKKQECFLWNTKLNSTEISWRYPTLYLPRMHLIHTKCVFRKENNTKATKGSILSQLLWRANMVLILKIVGALWC